MSDRDRYYYYKEEEVIQDGKPVTVKKEVKIPGVSFEVDNKGVVHPVYQRPDMSSRHDADYYRNLIQEATNGSTNNSNNADLTYVPKADERY